jgi:uncharacterized integral membrane protein (TIGR00697 family)
MSFLLIIAWAVGVTSFTLLGSLYARRYARPDLLIGLYVTFVIIAQILAIKNSVFDIGLVSFRADAGILVFAVTFLLTDIVNERFGKKETLRMIGVAFIAQVAMTFFIWLGMQFDTDPLSRVNGEHWNALFAITPQITIANWLSFLISESVDVYIYAWFKELTHGRYLWLRNVVSALPAFILDSFIFTFIAYWGAPFAVLYSLSKSQIVLKWVVGVVSIPFVYANHALLTRGSYEHDVVLWEEATGE